MPKGGATLISNDFVTHEIFAVVFLRYPSTSEHDSSELESDYSRISGLSTRPKPYVVCVLLPHNTGIIISESC